MATTVLINNFSGGVAQDIREERTTTFSYSSGFDTFSNSHKLSPYRVTETESLDTGVLTNQFLTDVCIMKDAVNTNIYALGQAGLADTNAKFYQKSTTMDISSPFQECPNGEDTSNNVIACTLVTYKSKLYCLKTDNTNTFLVEHNHATSSITTKADGGAGTTLNGVAVNVRPFRHPLDDILYIGHGNYISKLDNTTLTRNVLALPSDSYITSLTDYGSYLAIATSPVNGGVSSKVYLWNRDTSLTTTSEVINFGEGNLQILENINGTLIGVMSSNIPTTNSVFNLKTKLIVKGYSGGTPQIIKEITTTSASFTLPTFKSKQANRLFFACKSSINGTALNQIWVVGTNGNNWYCSPDRLVNNDTALTGEINGFNILGDYLWVGFNNNGSFYRTKYSADTYPTCVYESLINHGMTVNDRTKKKILKSVSVAKSSTSGQLVLKYSVDGSSYATIGTLSASGSIVMKMTNESDGKPFLDGYEFKFKVESTNGAEFTELKYSYDIVPELI